MQFQLPLFPHQQQSYEASDALLNITAEVEGILSGVCHLLEMQELVAKVDSESNLHTIIEANILDSCHWVRL